MYDRPGGLAVNDRTASAHDAGVTEGERLRNEMTFKVIA